MLSTAHWFVVAGMVISASVGEFCDKTMVKQAWDICEEAYKLERTDGDIGLEEFCQAHDCIIQCIKDAVGDCVNDDTFLDVFREYDVEMIKVFLRALCSNITMAAEILGEDGTEIDGHCPITRTCTNQQTAYANLPQLYTDGKYKEYKELLCNTSTSGRVCISVNSTENCTAATAKYHDELLNIVSSHSICENNDLQHLYMKYGGDVTCRNPKVKSKCFASKVFSEASKCVSLLTTAGDIETSISQFCDSIECTVKCYTDAIGDCENEEGMPITMDSTIIKVTGRASCDNQEELIKAYKECKMQNQSCYSELEQGMSVANTLLDQQNYTAYRQAVCSSNSMLRNCVKYIPAGNCTSEMASLLKGITDVTYSYATCGAQDHAYFTTYGGDINCDKSSSGTPLANTLLSGLLFLAAVLFY